MDSLGQQPLLGTSRPEHKHIPTRNRNIDATAMRDYQDH
jgi:hypothetical protein